jgi:5-methylcytosine-specific restriction enzyme A
MATGPRWSEAELRACVEAYAAMMRDVATGREINRTKVGKSLTAGPLSARTEGSVYMRFSNISAILEKNGKKSLSNFKPLGNVGPPSQAVILSLLQEVGLA